jgi:glucan phosphoethanolaminetransferase (alkaline phosphatase superfamily)
MIQRIQTVYLLLTTILAVLFLSGDIILFENGKSLLLAGYDQGIEGAKPESIWPMTFLLLIIPVLSFILIFLYKNRKLQMKLTVILILMIVLCAAMVGYFAWNLSQASSTEIVFTYKMILPAFMLIFSILAYIGIKKDEEIVRSYDRLR